MSWMDKFDPKLQTMAKEVDAQIAPQLAKIDARILENQFLPVVARGCTASSTAPFGSRST